MVVQENCFQVSCLKWPDEEPRLQKCMYMCSAKVDINHLGQAV